jgi:hypothetical protein
MKLALILFSTALGSLCTAAQPSIGDRAFNFLKMNMMGRVQEVSTEGTLTSEGEEYLVRFEAKIKWDGLTRTPEGLLFNETRDIKQTSTKIDKAGKTVGTPINTDRVVVHHYALGERPATGAMVGVTTVAQSSLEDPTGKAFVTMVQLSDDNKEFYVYQSMAGYAEASLDGKDTIPVSTASEATFSLNKKGKLQTVETLKFYKVELGNGHQRKETNRFNLFAIETP